LTLFPFFSASAQDPMDAYVAASFQYMHHSTEIEKGNRTGGKLQFTRLSRWVEMDLRLANGAHYTDYGAMLRFFKHWRFKSERSTGISLGMGAGFLSSPGVTNGNFAAGTAEIDGKKRPFMDYALNPFSRFVFDTGKGWGLTGELGLDYILSRNYSTAPQDLPRKNSSARYRYTLSVGVALAVD